MRGLLDELGGWHVEQGDNLLVLPTLPAESCDSIVTDPPYGLSFMGKDWDHGVPGPHFWVEALRVAKPGAYLLAFGGTRTHHRLACAIDDAGWEIRDCIMWLYGSGFPKSHNLGDGRGTALKPAWEPIIMARKPLIGTVAVNVQKYGTGAINIDGCRIGMGGGTRKDDFTPGTPSNALMGGLDGKLNGPAGNLVPGLGRWPANLIHDGSEDVVVGFPDSKGAMADVQGDEPSRPGYSGGFGRGPASSKRGDSGSASRFFYCAKASKADRNEGLEGESDAPGTEYRPNDDGSHGIQSRLHGATDKGRNNHPTVKPTPLMRYLCKLVTPLGGVVLDPFAGSGSTGKAARLEGFRFLGIELEESYCTIARARIGAAKA
jgi:site-specific DNA-methyltransferase (adenine-specific)